MTPEQRRQWDLLWSKAVNAPRDDDLATRLADRTTRSVAVPSHDALVVRGAMRAVAPFIAELQQQIAALEERVSELEDRP